MPAIHPFGLVEHPQFLAAQLEPAKFLEIESGLGIETEIEPDPSFSGIFHEAVLAPEAVADDDVEIRIELVKANLAPSRRLVERQADRRICIAVLA